MLRRGWERYRSSAVKSLRYSPALVLTMTSAGGGSPGAQGAGRSPGSRRGEVTRRQQNVRTTAATAPIPPPAEVMVSTSAGEYLRDFTAEESYRSPPRRGTAVLERNGVP